MNLSNYYKIINNYLISLIEFNDWEEVVLNIDIQPNVLGLNGYLIISDLNKISLRTRPTEILKETIHQLHIQTATSIESRWNKFQVKINKNKTVHNLYIWDEVWQQEIDSENRKVKDQNPDYNISKWHWEKS